MAKAMYIGVKPNLPNGYTQVEYIESTGTQYLDLDYIAPNNARVLMVGSFAENASNADGMSYVFGATDAYNTNGFGFGYSKGSVHLTTNTTIRNFNTSICDGKKYIIDCSPSKLIIDGTTYFNQSQAGSTSVDMFLFAYNNQGKVFRPAIMKLYSFKIYEGNTLVRDFVPVVNSIGLKGLYDLVKGTFRMTLSDTNFLAGAEVDSVARKVIKPYIGVNGVARKVKKAYIGDANGKAKLIYTS